MVPQLDRVDARNRLTARRDPYWMRLSQGRYVGFRKLAAASEGTWLARFYDGTAYQQKPLGDFGDLLDKERFDAAKREAEAWFKHLDHGGSTEHASVRVACEAYVEQLRAERSEASAKDAHGRFKRLVYDDPLARVELAKLAPRHFVEWKKRVRAGGGARTYFNRNLTSLRAALNLAYDRREVASRLSWSKELRPVKLEENEGRRTLYLKPIERRKLIEKAHAELRPFLTTLALLPLRPGEVAQLKVEHFESARGVLHVPKGKTGMRRIPLPREAAAYLKACAKDKLPTAWLIARADGRQWDRFAWRDFIKPAAAAAKLPAATCAYTLRHSTITDLVTAGLDLFTVAKISGTSVSMIERHYGKLQPEHARKALEGLALG